MQIMRPVVFLNRIAGQVDDPSIRDFRPANELAAERVMTRATQQQDETPDPKASSFVAASASVSDGDSNKNETPGTETDPSQTSPSESLEDPVNAEKAKSLHPSGITRIGSVSPPAVA